MLAQKEEIPQTSHSLEGPVVIIIRGCFRHLPVIHPSTHPICG
ncbi:MAG: hypothetical protein PUP93_11930 [Rhizonema sp. NSF051]|nr:hypothetical protein [Rhizonema sp. NSF051]